MFELLPTTPDAMLSTRMGISISVSTNVKSFIYTKNIDCWMLDVRSTICVRSIGRWSVIFTTIWRLRGRSDAFDASANCFFFSHQLLRCRRFNLNPFAAVVLTHRIVWLSSICSRFPFARWSHVHHVRFWKLSFINTIEPFNWNARELSCGRGRTIHFRP